MKNAPILTWPGRERVLLAMGPQDRPVWGTPGDIRPGRLVPHATVGATPPGAAPVNQLVRGNNLLALKTLEVSHAGSAALIYIDPPYNTRQAMDHYADGFDEAVWLSMMDPRLRALRVFLRPDGLLAVHIDYRELFPLKLLLDEVFGPGNFVSMITVKVKDSAGVGQQSPIFDVCEYILLYARDLPVWRKRRRAAPAAGVRVGSPVRGYRKTLLDSGTPTLVKTLHRPRMGPVSIYRCSGYRIGAIPAAAPMREYVAQLDRIFADYNPGGGSILSFKREIPAGTLAFIEYTPSKGRDAGRTARVYFLNRRILAWLRDTAVADGPDALLRHGPLTNCWEMSNAQLHAEGGVDFKFGKKPEALLARLINFATLPGELVLDAFLGSGTTAATAHKLGRRWIGIESAPTVRTHALARLKRVVAGTDPSGITASSGWSGGGSFTYFELKQAKT